jgi:hypothetical protein
MADNHMDCATTTGGNTTIRNGDEAVPRADAVSEVSMVVVPGGSDDFSHVNPMFRES